jgi:hypothetical protein
VNCWPCRWPPGPHPAPPRRSLALGSSSPPTVRRDSPTVAGGRRLLEEALDRCPAASPTGPAWDLKIDQVPRGYLILILTVRAGNQGVSGVFAVVRDQSAAEPADQRFSPTGGTERAPAPPTLASPATGPATGSAEVDRSGSTAGWPCLTVRKEVAMPAPSHCATSPTSVRRSLPRWRRADREQD